MWSSDGGGFGGGDLHMFPDHRPLEDEQRRAVQHLQPQHGNQFKQLFDALRELMTPPDSPKRPIGFVTPEDKGKKTSGVRSKKGSG